MVHTILQIHFSDVDDILQQRLFADNNSTKTLEKKRQALWKKVSEVNIWNNPII